MNAHHISVIHPMRAGRAAFATVETPLNPWLLNAWLGYAVIAPRLTVRICSWCPDADRANAAARAQGLAITHTRCPSCVQKGFAELLGEAFTA